MAEMEQSSAPAISGSGVEDELRFRRPRRMWAPIPWMVFAVLAFWVALVTHGLNPMKSPAFVFFRS